MTHVLKSNVIVPDPTGRFQYLTKFGVTGKDLARYVTAMETAGLVMSQAHFNAFNDFYSGTLADGTWAHIKEIYPLYGKTLAQAAIKLKRDLAAVDLASVNGLALAHFELDGNGLILGTANRAYSDTLSPAFDTGLPISALTSTWGAHFYIDGTGIAYTAGLVVRELFGAYVNLAGQKLTVARVRFGADASQVNLHATNTSTAAAGGLIVGSLKGLAGFQATPADGTTRLNGAVVGTGALVYDGTVDRSMNAWLLAKRPADGNNANPTQGFNGKMRFGVITDGLIPNELQAGFNTRVNTLMAALGKAFP